MRRRKAVPVLRATVQEVGNVMIITGGREPLTVLSEIVAGVDELQWVDAAQPAGRLTVRVSAIVALWVE